MTTLPTFKTPQDVFDLVLSQATAATLPTANLKGLVSLQGEGGGDWTVAVENKKLSIKKGTVKDPQVSLGMDAADFVGLANRQINPMALLMQGKIKASGDMALVMQLQGLLTQFQPK